MNPKPPPITPNALRVEEALNRSEPLVRLRSLLADSNARFDAIQRVLPPGLRTHLKPGPVDDAGWSILAANAAVAAKLRQLQPRLEQTLSEAGWAPAAIRIKVVAAGR